MLVCPSPLIMVAHSLRQEPPLDQAIMSEEERLVVIRFGRDYDPDCMRQDEVLYRSSLTPI